MLLKLSSQKIYYQSYTVCVEANAQEMLVSVGSTTCNVAEYVSTAAESHAQTQAKDKSRKNQMYKLTFAK